MSKELIRLSGIVMAYDGEEVLKSVDLSIQDKEFLTLLGPSGCGKTTTLRIIGGFESPLSGDIFFDNVKINDVPPYKRNVNTVFQKYALFPHMNVYDNVAFGLRLKKIPEKEIARRVAEMLEIVNLTGYDKRSPNALSGGQQQRVAIARALINHPQVLLLDEPLGALDLKLRKEMQFELKQIQKQLGITFIYVTHDQEEALTMSDTVVVMRDGTIQQKGKPEDIYNEPANAFVADFIGESNIIPATMIRDRLVAFAGTEFACVDKGFGMNMPVDVVVRPEDIVVSTAGPSKIAAVITTINFKGVHYEMLAEGGEYEWLIHSTSQFAPGTLVGLDVAPENIHIMNKSDVPIFSEDEIPAVSENDY